MADSTTQPAQSTPQTRSEREVASLTAEANRYRELYREMAAARGRLADRVDEVEGLVVVRDAQLDALRSDRNRFRDHATALSEALEWVSDRYGHTLGGRPVRDADEALLRAENALKVYRRSIA